MSDDVGVVRARANEFLIFGGAVAGLGRTSASLRCVAISSCGDSAERQGEEESNNVSATTDEPYVHSASNMLLGQLASDL
jgi:hypothetical protein